MKKTFLCLLLLVAGALNAQIVNIPDAAFKSALITGYGADFKDLAGNELTDADINNDGEIQASEVLQMKEVIVNGAYDITSVVGIEAFTNLEKLAINSLGNLTSINVSALTNLQEFSSSQCYNLTSLNISGLVNLKKLDCSYTKVGFIDVAGFTALTQLTAQYTDIVTLDATGLTSLVKADFMGSHLLQALNFSGLTNLVEINANFTIYSLSSLVLSGNVSLEKLNCSQGNLTALNVSGLPNLKVLNCSSNHIATPFDLSASPLIETIDAGSNEIPSINIQNKQYLQTASLEYNNVADFDIGFCPALTILYIAGNNIVTADLSLCPVLQTFNSSENPLEYINIKNGNIASQSFSIGFGASYTDAEGGTAYGPLHICVDEGEEYALLNYYANYPDLDVLISTYCTFTPGGNYNTIAGTVTFDADNNGCGAGDIQLPYTAIQLNDGTQTATVYSANGNYSFYTQSGTFTLTPQFENGWFTSGPQTVNFATVNNSTVTQNFCVTANGVHNDAEVTIVPLMAARPGFDTYYKIIYKNKGNQVLSGNVTFTYDDAVLDYVNASPVETTATTGNLSWAYTNLLPFESREIYLTLNVNSPVETPAVVIDDVLSLVAAITPTAGDETPADNSFTLNQTVVGSFDPNDITCLEGATVNPDKIGEYLHYNINFENTGTFLATFVVVKDIIDETKFDVSSLVVLNASHDVETRVTGNKVEFYFNEINLTANGGKGNITFKIKSLETLAVNTSVRQKADIFFDYNWPIFTNEALTTYGILNNPDFSKDASVKIYPNPTKNVVTISAASTIQSIQLFDIQGRLLEASAINNVSAALDIASRANGIYFIKIATDKGVNVEKLIKE